jgi:protein-tyrosine phosphatase
MVKRVLFVCMGNICRSPAAEGVLRHALAEGGLEELIEVDSAGTLSYHTGEPADPRMRRAAERRGYRLESLARKVRRDDFQHFDLLVAMDRDNHADLTDLAGRAADRIASRSGQLRLLSDFLPPGSPLDVPDPYYGGGDGFERVLDMLEEACPRLLSHLLEE